MISSSMSAKGCYRNNAVVESFLSNLKHELVLNDDAETLNNPPQQLIRKLAFWINGYYNRESHHSTTGHLSPITCDQNHVNTRRLDSVEPKHLSTELG
jgi:putative transposase